MKNTSYIVFEETEDQFTHKSILGLSATERIVLNLQKLGAEKIIIFLNKNNINRSQNKFDCPNVSHIEFSSSPYESLLELIRSNPMIDENVAVILSGRVYSRAFVKMYFDATATDNEALLFEDASKNLFAMKFKKNSLDAKNQLSDIQVGLHAKVFFKNNTTLSTSLVETTSAIKLDSLNAVKRAKKTMLQSLVKPTDNWVSRNLNRPISIFISQYLVLTPLTANQVSIFIFFISVLNMWVVSGQGYISSAVGCFLYHMASVLDGCDGEVARLKFQDSNKGAWIDTSLDMLSHIFFYAGLSMAYVNTAHRSLIYLGWFGILGLIGFLATTTLMYKSGGSFLEVSNENNFLKGNIIAKIIDFLRPLMFRATYAFIFFILGFFYLKTFVFFLMSFMPILILAVMMGIFFKNKTFNHKARLH